MQIFLTGGTGLLGNNVLRQGMQRGWRFTALARKSSDPQPFAGLDVDLVYGELDDQKCINDHVQKCDVVIHSAAQIHIGWKKRDESMRANRDGTQSMVDAARTHHKPMVYVSTVNTLAIGQPEAPSNENTPGDGQIPSTYVLTKRAAEQVVSAAMAGADNPLQATIVHPGFMLGPNDWKPSSGRMIVELAHRSPPMSPAGGCSVCDVRDVAGGILTIIDQQRYGERYVLAGQNMTYFDLWTTIAKKFNRRGPYTVLRRPGQFVIGIFADLFLSGKEESVANSAAIKMSSQFHYHDSSHAANDLGYSNRSLDETLSDAIVWMREHGKL
jgi:dihydroflavonol-4-reductase